MGVEHPPLQRGDVVPVLFHAFHAVDSGDPAGLLRQPLLTEVFHVGLDRRPEASVDELCKVGAPCGLQVEKQVVLLGLAHILFADLVYGSGLRFWGAGSEFTRVP